MQKKYSKVTTDIICLTPERAKELLSGQTVEQRKISSAHVFRYADAIKRGLWLYDGSPIKIDWFGQLIDGQHRCRAVIVANKPIKKILILYGLDPEVFKVLDRGKMRTHGDVLRKNGEAHYNCLASAIVICLSYDKGKNLQSSGDRGAQQSEDVLKYLENNPLLRESVMVGRKAKEIMQGGAAAFLHYLFRRIHKEDADKFFDKLISGEGFVTKDPIRLLRDRLLWSKAQSMNRMKRTYKIAIAIKAWNAFRSNKNITKLAWRDRRHPDEPLPKPI